MRILHVKFTNLNSLAGSWSIDFTDPAYEQGGVFAITGPTGAGKSTILDALCLGLFSRTPRLNKITASSNGIMSTGTNFCGASVVFEAGGRRFRVLWSQKRRKKGDFAQPVHKLLELQPCPAPAGEDDPGTPIADKTKEVLAKIEELTGLDYERFTKSMLLAQGSFADFMKAKETERAPLLEQITGTQIYADISSTVYKTTDRIKNELDDLREELEGLSLLTEEDAGARREEIAHCREALDDIGREAHGLESILVRREKWAALEERLAENSREREALERDAGEFAPSLERLGHALAARNLVPEHQMLRDLESRLTKLQEEKRTTAAKLSLMNKECELASAREQQCGKAAADAETRLAVLQEMLKTIRAMDQNTAHLQAALATERSRLDKARAGRTEAGLMLRTAEHDLGEHGTSRTELAGMLAAGPSATVLTELRAELNAVLERMESQEKTGRDAKRELAELETRRRALGRQAENARLALAERQAGADALSARILETEKNKAELFGPSISSELYNECALMARHVANAEKLHGTAVRAAGLAGRLEEFRAETDRLADLIRRNESALQACMERHDGLVNQIRLLDENIRLQDTIRGLSAEREKLQEGVPCPLCGALHHPLAEAFPDDRHTERDKREKKELEEKQEQLEAETNKLKMALATDRAGRESAEKAACRTQEELGAALDSLAAMLVQEAGGCRGPECGWMPVAARELGTRTLPAGLAEAASRHLDTMKLENEALERRAAQLAGMERLISDLEKQHRAAVQNLGSVQSEYTGCELGMKETDAEARARQSLMADCAGQIRDLGTRAQGLLARAGIAISGSALDDIRTAVAELERRLATRTGLENQLDSLERLISRDEQTIQFARKNLGAAEQTASQLASSVEKLEKELGEEQGKRFELFGDRNADQEEKKARTGVDAARARHEEAKLGLEQASREIAAAEGGLQNAEIQEKELAPRLEARKQRWTGSILPGAGFATQDAWETALLPEAETSALQARKDALEKKRHELDALGDSLKAQRKELGPETDDRDTELLKERLASLKKARDEAVARTALLENELAENERKKATGARLQASFREKEKEWLRWDALNKLIGSAKGDKFRTYVQSLTFRILLGHANKQLRMLTDRYHLVESRTEALSLDILDHYQADEERPAQNLSGGESFLVSLSLALGLGRMTGGNVRIDSMFLDEGFGTLDDDALGVALNALASLHQRGKTVGIISHVQSVKERIETQIAAIPAGNGRSELSGPGVTREQAEA